MSATVTIPAETEQAIQRLIDSGRLHDANDVIITAIEVLTSHETEHLDHVRELVLAGRSGGPRRELTEELMDELERRSEERFQRGERPASHVCP